MAQAPDHELEQLSDDGRSIQGDRSPRLGPSSITHSPTEVRGTTSFESRESRPTSPHNVSSPNWGNQQSFLAVPQARSRGASIDSEVETAIGSDTTQVNTAQPGNDVPFGKGGDLKSSSGLNEPAIVPDEEALNPDPGTEKDFERENNPFAFTPGQLGKLFNPKSLGAFRALGGLTGIEKGLRTDRNTGLSVDEQHLQGQVSFKEATTTTNDSPKSSDSGTPFTPTTGAVTTEAGKDTFTDRLRIFQDNRLPEKKTKSIFQLMWLAYNDKVLIVLTVAAVIALALGLYQALSGGGVEWIEGVAIIIAIIVVVIVGALNDWQKEKQFAKLNKKKADRNVKVVRSGKTQEINVYDLCAGDVLLIEPGDVLPVDGILISGHGIKCDESSATGESDLLKKTPGDEVFAAMQNNGNLKKMDPFMISGGKVTEGIGRMQVTAVGVHSSYGKTMLTLQESNDMTPLQAKLNKLAEYIAKIGSAAAILLFVILLIKFLAELRNNPDTPEQKGRRFLNILITAVTIIVVAVPEGLPLAVTLALAYATRRMLKDRNLVRVLRSCETMGNATTVCSDKTGTLTQNVMTVVAGSIGTSSRFRDRPAAQDASNKDSAAVDEVDAQQTNEFIATLAASVKALLKDSIAINSTAFEREDDGKLVFVGSKTETALLEFAKDFLGMDKVQIERDNVQIVQMIPFDSGRKCMGMVIKNRDTKGYRLIVKGASEIMLRQSSQIISDPTKDITGVALNADNKGTLESLINNYASRSLRTIGLLYRDFESESWPPKGV